MSDATVSFSIAVPTYKRPRALTTCLTALRELDYPHDRYEVIVIDDGGPEDLTSLIQPFRDAMNIKLLRQTNAGPAAARNNGAKVATSEFIAFTDDDCAPHRDWLAHLAAAFTRDPDVLAGGYCPNALPNNLYAVASQSIVDVVHSHFNWDHEHAVFFPSDNLAMKRDRFNELGGFNPEFRCSEDRDFCDRWSARGWRLVFVPLAIADHAHEMGFDGFCRQHFGYGRGAWRFHRAREARKSGTFKVDMQFYLKCFRQPFVTLAPTEAVSVAALMCVWQLANAAGFFCQAMSQPDRRSQI